MGCTDNRGANHPPLYYEQKREHPDDIRKVIEADLRVGIPLYQCLTPRCPDDNCNKEIIEQPVNLSTLTHSYIDNDRRFIQRSVEAKKPFFLYLPLSHMHVPHDYAQKFKNSSAEPSIYGDTLRELDLSRVLFDGSDQGHAFLFHPDPSGTLSAVRYNQYQAYYTTYSVIDGACGGERGLTIDHKSLLIFDLSRDLAESIPIEVPQSVYDAIDLALQAKLNYIYSTPHTKVDYRIEGVDARACCDAGHIVCRCTD